MVRTTIRRLTAACIATILSACAVLGQDGNSNSIQGIAQNESGEPVPNARVDISTAAPVSGPAVFCPSCYLDCQKWTTTDESGRFEITDLDTRLKFRLVISANGYKTAQTELIAPEGILHEVKLRDRPKTADYQRTVQGLIRNATGIAVQGALVSPVATIDNDGLRTFSANGVSPAVSDADGQFEIDLVDGVSGIDIEIAAEGLCNRRFVDLTPGDVPKKCELFEGASIGGSVYDHGNPVIGMTISVAQTDRATRGEKFFLKAMPTVTDAQGRFELKNLLPSQEYCIYTVIGEADRNNSASIVRTQKFIAPSSGEYLDIGRLATVQPVSFGGRIVLSPSDSFENLFLFLNREPAWDMIKIPVGSDGSFRIDGLPPEVYEIYVRTAHYELDADKIDSLVWMNNSIKRLIDKSYLDYELPIRRIDQTVPNLEPNGMQTLSGRVVLSGENGVAGIRVDASDSVEALGKGLGNGNAPWTTTSKDGHFTLAELPDTRVWLKLYRPDEDGMRFWYLGMVKPSLNNEDITIRLGPEARFEPDTLSGRGK